MNNILPLNGGFFIKAKKKDFISDETIVSEIRKNDYHQNNLLLTRYKTYCWALAHEFIKQYSASGIEAEELMLVSLNAFYVAIKTFSEGHNNFYPYWKRIAENDVNRYIRENSYQYGAKGFVGISLDSTYDGVHELHDTISTDEEDPKKSLNSLSRILEDILADKNNGFSLEEKEIINNYLLGYDLKEISKLMGLKQARVYYVYQKLINKIRKILVYDEVS